MNTRNLGGRGEGIAAEYLSNRGCRLLDKNFRVKSGEIDLVVMDRGCLCFVEVKARRSYGTPQEAVTKIKQRKLTKLAQVYLKEKYRSVDVRCRFDVVAVEEKEDGSTHIKWFQNAFDAL
jgi:putative endonuclease